MMKCNVRFGGRNDTEEVEVKAEEGRWRGGGSEEGRKLDSREKQKENRGESGGSFVFSP